MRRCALAEPYGVVKTSEDCRMKWTREEMKKQNEQLAVLRGVLTGLIFMAFHGAL